MAAPSHVEPRVEGWYEKLGVLYLQLVINSLAEYNSAISGLKSQWNRLLPEQRRELFTKAAAALQAAEIPATAIASWRGAVGKVMKTKLDAVIASAKKAGDDPKTQIGLLDRKALILHETLLGSDVLLEPKPNAEDLYESFREYVVSESDPVEPDPGVDPDTLDDPDDDDLDEDEDEDEDDGETDDDLDHVLDGLDGVKPNEC